MDDPNFWRSPRAGILAAAVLVAIVVMMFLTNPKAMLCSPAWAGEARELFGVKVRC